MNSPQLPTDVVYSYTPDGLIRIQRTREGKWTFHYTVKQIVDHINNKRRRNNPKYKLSDLMSYSNSEDMLQLGLIIGMKAEQLITQCQKSYGDE